MTSDTETTTAPTATAPTATTQPAAETGVGLLDPQATDIRTIDPLGSAAAPALPEAGPDSGGVRSGRERIDAIDAQLIALIQQRIAVSTEIQAARLADGGRRLDLRRETEVIGRFTRALGRPGTAVAMALLELGRGKV